ncbi:two pore calcium channel protein 1-like isoform X2 [Palaemon carinicauda]|uniref:two pore calcium channel protein 1-like isoform X2 n=1 Tax=Palaemon carinicauda TaxID=392227 RepID=UPI0035B58B24
MKNPSNKMTHCIPIQQDLMLAATYVEDARCGRHSDFKISERHLKMYHLYQNKWGQLVLYAIFGIHLLLALFEKPAVQGLEVSLWITMAIEIAILCLYLFRLAHISIFTPLTRFWSDTKHIIIFVLVALTILDMIIYVGLVESGSNAVRWSRVFRPLFAVNFPEMKQIRRSFRNLRRTFPDLINVLGLFFFCLSIFSLMGYKLFGGRGMKWVDGRPYFDTYWDSLFDMYVLVTTANNPDIMMPAYDASPYYVIFFVLFLVICFFLYMNIILAVIYNNYRKYLKNEVKKTVYSKRQQLSKAFDILAVNSSSRQIVTKERFVQLMKKIDSENKPALINVLWIILDTDGSECLDKGEFLKLADLLNVEVIEVVDRRILIQKIFPSLFFSKPSQYLCKVVKHRYFQIFFDVLTLVNAVVIGISTNSSEWDDTAEWIFLGLFLIEIILKLYVYGPKRFFLRLWNVFDFVVIGAAFIMASVEAGIGLENQSRLSLDVLLVLRVLRLVKIIGSVERFKIIVHSINKIIPSLLTYGGVVMVFYYIFAIIGVEAFQGLVKFSGYDAKEGDDLFCSNKKLNNTEFWHVQYCNNNFNNIIRAFIVMFELTVVNQWHVIAYGFASVTNSWARLYFVVFHQICVIVVLNIFTAFVLEVFILEYSANRGHFESQVEKKIQDIGLSIRRRRRSCNSAESQEDLVVTDSENSEEDGGASGSSTAARTEGDNTDGEAGVDPYTFTSNIADKTDVRFLISKRVKNVEVLLQKMFEKELDVEELGPNIVNLDQDLEDERSFYNNRNFSSWNL